MKTSTTRKLAQVPVVYPHGATHSSEKRAEKDAVVFAKVVNGNEKALSQLMEDYSLRLTRFIVRQTGDPDRAEDILQEVWLRVWRHRKNFDSAMKFSTWIYTIAGNFCKNELRNRTRSIFVPFLFFEEGTRTKDMIEREFVDPRADLDVILRNNGLKEMVEETIMLLQPSFRTIFILREINGYRYDKIADVTGINIGTVKSRINRGREQFRRIIAPKLEHY